MMCDVKTHLPPPSRSYPWSAAKRNGGVFSPIEAVLDDLDLLIDLAKARREYEAEERDGPVGRPETW